MSLHQYCSVEDKVHLPLFVHWGSVPGKYISQYFRVLTMTLCWFINSCIFAKSRVLLSKFFLSALCVRTGNQVRVLTVTVYELYSKVIGEPFCSMIYQLFLYGLVAKSFDISLCCQAINQFNYMLMQISSMSFPPESLKLLHLNL